VLLVGFIIRIYHDERCSECQKRLMMFGKVVGGYFENHKNPINTLLRQSSESLML